MYLVDPREGASGDTILGALFAASEISKRRMEEVLSTAGSVMEETRVKLTEVEERGVKAIRVDVEWEGEMSEISALKMKEHLVNALEAVSLPRDERFAREAFERIIRAEEEYHREPLGYLHLHETGTPDTLVDIVGVAYLRWLLEMEGEWVE
ncbi:MAG: DUF111 family protein, partial [Thermoplasmata archaeon]|nr:DUF111 family protein [Thermoplasmata archaeon]